MVAANILLFLYLFDVTKVQFKIGTITLSMWNAVIIVAIFINVEQSIWDCAIPYILVYTAKFYERFRFW